MPGKAKGLPQPRGQYQQLGVYIRTIHAKTFHANLVELAVAAFLGTLVAEHRAGVPKPASLVEQQAMLFRCPDTPRGSLRAKGQAVAIPVVKGVHFFFDNVSYFTNRALEQFGLFNHRHADFLVSVLSEYLTYRRLYILPRSEERRVGKECRSRWSTYDEKKKKDKK